MIELSPNLKMFNDKIRLLNQTNSKQIVLSAQEARNLHTELFDLLNHFSTLNHIKTAPEDKVITVEMDGGGF
jgi:hypothetical protein